MDAVTTNKERLFMKIYLILGALLIYSLKGYLKNFHRQINTNSEFEKPFLFPTKSAENFPKQR